MKEREPIQTKNRALHKKRAAFILAAIVLMAISVEATLRISDFFIQKIASKKELLQQDTGMDKGNEWEKILLEEKEGGAETLDYEPFLGWRGRERHGKYVNTDSQGLRTTWNPQYPDEKKIKTVYVFGGSTIWGMGARDHHTIPSYLSKHLHEKGYHFIVHNYGEHGYIFFQEVMRLTLLLRNGYRPDYVIFYDGYNDVYTAYKSGMAGTIYGFFETRKKLEEKQPSHLEMIGIGAKGLLKEFKEDLMIYKGMKKISAFFTPSSLHTPLPKYDDNKLQSLANGVVQYYATSLELLDHLAKAYGFKYLCFWQPVLYTEDKMTEEESKTLETDINVINDPSVIKLQRYTNQFLDVKSLPHFFNIQNALDGRTESYYTDSCHLTEKGNEVVAEKIVDIFEKKSLK